DDRTPGKGLAEMLRDQAGNPVAAHAAEGTPDRDPQIAQHLTPMIVRWSKTKPALRRVAGAQLLPPRFTRQESSALTGGFGGPHPLGLTAEHRYSPGGGQLRDLL